MFTANSMNCLCEAIGIALPGNGTVPGDAIRSGWSSPAGPARQIVKNTLGWIKGGCRDDYPLLPA